MADHKRRQDRQQSEETKGARHEGGREADRGHAREHDRDCARLLDRVAGCREQAEQRHGREARELGHRHDLNRQELAGFHAEQARGPGQERQAEREADARALDRFQQTQREQLDARHQLEQREFGEQARAAADLQQRQRRDADAQPGAEREHLEVRQRKEQEQLDAHFRAQARALKDHAERLQAVMERDQGAFQRALYAERQTDLRETLARQEDSRRELEQGIANKLADLDRQRERSPDPARRPEAEFGDIKPHRQQSRAVRSEEGARLSEHEHIRARINLLLQTLDPETGQSAYDNKAYRASVTLTIPRDMAVEKTRMDLELRDRLRDAQKTGVVSPELVKDMDIQADIERTIRARDLAIEARQAAGQNLADLLAITDQKIIEAAHLQQSELFHVGKQQRSPLAGASERELDRHLDDMFDRWNR